MTRLQEGKRQAEVILELLVIFVILVSLGFPGNLTEKYGDWLGSVLEYGAFAVELLVMLLSGGSSWRDMRILSLERRYGMLYLFVAVLFVESMLVSRFPTLQFITSTRLTVTLFFAIWLQERFRFERMIELICTAQAIFTLFTLLFTLSCPNVAFESGKPFVHALKGLYPTKNSMASELSFGMIVMAFLIREKRRNREGCFLWMVFLLVQGVLVVMCQATGAILTLLVAMAPLLLPKDIRLPLGWGYIGCNILFLFATRKLMPYLEWFFTALGKDATLTGRIPLWNRIISVMTTHHTFTGYGYGMFWRDREAVALIHTGFPQNSFLGTMKSGAHNMLLEFWLNSGLIGIAVFFAALLYSTREIDKIPEKPYLFSWVILAYLLMNGLTERCLGGNYDYKTFGLFLVMALCCNRPERENHRPTPGGL